MNETTQPSSQTASRLQYFSTRLEEHYNKTDDSQHPTLQTINESEQSSSNTTGQQHHSVECNNSMDNSPRTTKVQHPWTSEQHGKERAKGKGKGKKGHHKGKVKTTYKGKGFNNTYHNNNKGNGKGYGPIGQGNPFKGSSKGNPGKGKSSPPKGKGKDNTTIATNVASKVTLPGIVEFPSTNYDMGEQGNMPDPTYNWHNDPQQYDPSWYNQDLTQQGYANTSQLALPPPPQASSSSAQAINFVEEVLIAGIEDHQGESSSIFKDIV